MAAQVLHVTNQGQSVRMRIREGMRGRSLGRPSNALPCGYGEDLQEAPVLSSLVFNKLAPLHVHNQQLHGLTVDHGFVDVNAYHWSLWTMVLHIGATREQGHFVVHILVRDEWWLCDDASVTRGRPPADLRKVTFLLYERTPTKMVGLSQGGSQRGACNRGARGAPSQSATTTVYRHVPSMPSSTPLHAMALARGDSEYTNHVGEAQPSPSHSTAPTVNRHAPSLPSNTQLAAMALPTGHPECTTHVGDAQPSGEFVEVVAKLLQRQRVRVKQHLQVRVQAHRVLLRARHEKEWDERHAGQGMSHRSVAESIEQDRARYAALAATGSNAFCVMIGAAPRQRTVGPKTLQAFLDGHWHLRFTFEGDVMCICCAWGAQTDCPGVKRPPKAAAAFVNGTYGIGMRMMMAGPKTWRKDVLEGHRGVSRGTTSSRKKIDNPGRHHLTAEESVQLHCAERFRVPCPSASVCAVNVAENSTVFIRGEGMDLGVPMTDAVAAILSRLVEVYIGLRMCTSIRAISERILLHCTLTSEPGHHASGRWIVEKAMVAMHGAMQDGVSRTLQRALFIALLLDGSDRQRHCINEYAILLLFPGTGPRGMCAVFLGVVDVASGEAQEVTAQVEAVPLSWIPNRASWAQKVVAFAVDGASNLGVRGATARQAVDVSAMEHNVFAMLVKWLCLLTPLGEPCHVVQRKLGLALEAAGQMHGDYLAAVGRQHALYNGARQWKDLERCVQKNTGPNTHSGLRLIPASHRIRWSEANARRNKVFLANVPWVVRHLDSKAHLTTKEQDVWEDCHDAGLLSWALVYGDILHGTHSFNNVAQLHAPTSAHLTKATEMLQPRVEKVAREEGLGCTQFKEQTVTGAWHGVELVRFDPDGQRCTTSPPFAAAEARAVTDTLLAGIREGRGTIDPRGLLEWAVLLDHGRWLAVPPADRATFGVDLMKQFMGTHHAELAAAHVNAARALEEWASFKEHVVQTFAKTPMSRMWEALTLEREHLQWVNVWRVFAAHILPC